MKSDGKIKKQIEISTDADRVSKFFKRYSDVPEQLNLP
jgi:hypothetical protein